MTSTGISATRRATVQDADELADLLYDLNDAGHHPVVLIVDAQNVPGLAYLAEDGGDEVVPGVLIDGWSELGDHDQDLTDRFYPATVLWRPDQPAQVTTLEELAALPRGTVIRANGYVYERAGGVVSRPHWRRIGTASPWTDAMVALNLPATVLELPVDR